MAVPADDRTQGVTDQESYVEIAFDLTCDIAHWLGGVVHFFHVRLIRDENDILWITSNCFVLRRFAQMPGDQDDEGFEDIYEPLEKNWQWMAKTGVRDVLDSAVLYNEAILLAEAIPKDISYYYRGCADPTTTCHK